jgi:hypothetical protein
LWIKKWINFAGGEKSPFYPVFLWINYEKTEKPVDNSVHNVHNRRGKRQGCKPLILCRVKSGQLNFLQKNTLIGGFSGLLSPQKGYPWYNIPTK